MKVTLQTPLQSFSREFKSELRHVNLFMSLEEYIDKYYHPKEIMSFTEYCSDIADADKNGSVGTYNKTKANGKVVEKKANNENKMLKMLLKDPKTMADWTNYVDTTTRQNDEELRRIKAQWETSRYYELAGEAAAGTDLFKTDSDQLLTTQDEKDKAFYQEDTTQKRTIGVIFGLVAVFLAYKLISKK